MKYKDVECCAGAPDSSPEQQHLELRTTLEMRSEAETQQPNIVQNKDSVTRLRIKYTPPHIYTHAHTLTHTLTKKL